MTRNLYDLFQERFPEDPAAPFLETPEGRVYSYADMDATSARYAGLLRELGVGKGERVVSQVDKSADAVFLHLACLRCGAVHVPLNTGYPEAELVYFLADAEPRVIVCGSAYETAMGRAASQGDILTLDADGGGSFARRAAACSAEFTSLSVEGHDLATIIYTSGTTGRPKGAMLSHGFLAAKSAAWQHIWGWRRDDVLLHAMPVFHTHGLFMSMSGVFMSGSRMLFMPRFQVETLIRLLPRATVFTGVPTMYSRLLADGRLNAETCRAMRLFISASAPLSQQDFRSFRDRTGHTILEVYGMTETQTTACNPLHGERRAGTVGTALPEVELRVSDERGNGLPPGETGVLEVRSPHMFSGYWRQPEMSRAGFRQDGFFVTGDRARMDAGGVVSIVGRESDMIITGGYNVSPQEIETALERMDGLLEAAVIGLPHPDFGEGVTAVVRRDSGETALSAEDIIGRLKTELVNYKVPKRVLWIEDFPRTVTGKVQKNVLRERFKDIYTSPS
jgi:malonyl-CoA/methylmalonyl-CoA synthetase